jgi:deoxyribose-phosphate aldolase
MNLASYIDHTVLRPDCTIEDIKKICSEALQYKFAAVCIPPFFVKNAAQILDNSPVKVATVVGFPMGYSTTPAKVEEIKKGIDDGLDEIDAVVNIAAVKNGNWNYVKNDIYSVTMAGQLKGKCVKIILETGLLTEEEIKKLCEICSEIGPDFVKTSTGFNGEGATLDVVTLLRSNLPEEIKIKASGGIRSKEDAIRLIEAGAKRLGSSSGVMIVNDL